jgi:hypothetical protein
MFAPLLSAINEAGGGIPFTRPYSDGGFASRVLTGRKSGLSKEIAAAVKDAMKDVSIYATIEDIRREERNYVNIEQSANF